MICAPVLRDNPRALARGLSTVQAHKLCTMISSVDLAHYGVSRVKDWVSLYCGTICFGIQLSKYFTLSFNSKKSTRRICC